MKLVEILSLVNQFEKNNFLRIIEQIVSGNPKNKKKVDGILNNIDGQFKNADHISVQEIFLLIEDEYLEQVKREFSVSTSQLDILIDILIRDGNSIMSREWLLKLYDAEVMKIKRKSKAIKDVLSNEEESRIRDYRIYQACVSTAFQNDRLNNRENRVSDDEQSLLNTLVREMDLSHEEVKLLNYSVLPLEKNDIDNVISYLVKSGIVLYSRRNHEIYVPDEVVNVLRRLRGREVPDKVFRRVLKELKESQINLLARRHNIDKALSTSEKINEIIKEGLSFSRVLLEGIHKEGTNKTDRKIAITELIEKKLNLDVAIKGAKLEDKVENLVAYLNQSDNESNISISIHGYEKLLSDLSQSVPGFVESVRREFQLQDTIEINAGTMIKYNLKPIDILYTLSSEAIKAFCESKGVSTRGSEIMNVLNAYRDVQNLYLENYIDIAKRDINSLRNNNIDIKEAELGLQYEELTKVILQKLGLNVDEELRKKVNTAKNKVDIIVKLKPNEVIIFECKTKKDKEFSSYSRTIRQVKAYKDMLSSHGFAVIRTFIVAPEFSDDFVTECGLDYELNLSLITAASLLEISNAFQESKLKEFPVQILFKDVLIDSQRVVKSITR